MIILDIDIDIFLNHIAYQRSDDDPRLDSSEYKPDEIEFVRNFLEQKCLLSSKNKTPGHCVDFHKDVFLEVEKRIELSLFTPPFIWIHVDAHDDLNAPGTRIPPLTSGNFMIHLVAKNWLRKIIFVLHPEDTSLMHSKRDPLRIEYMGHSVPCDCFRKSSEGIKDHDLLLYREFKLKRKPDFAFITRSPSFTPPSSDAIFEFCRDYLDEN